MIRFVKDNTVFFVSAMLLAVILSEAPRPDATATVVSTNTPEVATGTQTTVPSDTGTQIPSLTRPENTSVTVPDAPTTTHYSVKRTRGEDDDDD